MRTSQAGLHVDVAELFENENTQSFPKCIQLQQQGKGCAINCNSGSCNRLVMLLARKSGCVLKKCSKVKVFCSVRVCHLYQRAFASYLINTAVLKLLLKECSAYLIP